MNEQTFWKRIARPSVDRCWEWLGAHNNTGYGTLIFNGKSATAHRVSAFLNGLVTTIAAPKNKTGGGFILHSCDNRGCCNPKHFTIGTYSKNQLDAYTRCRRVQPNGALHANAKLTNEDAQNIRKQYALSILSQSELANIYGVSQRVISLVVRNETYR